MPSVVTQTYRLKLMSQQVRSQRDLVGVVTIDENGDNLVVIKSNRDTLGQLMIDQPVGTSVTFEYITHPTFGEIVIPMIRRGFKQCDTSVTRTLLQN